LLLPQALIAFATPADGWLLHSLPAQQRTACIPKLKTFEGKPPKARKSLLQMTI
jgi:hypothetical protein